MPGAVTSGLGRNGPWLQNDWLRLDSRRDDASISLLAHPTGFRPAERGLAWADAGGLRLVPRSADYDVRPYEDILGPGRLLALRAAAAPGLTLVRESVLYDRRPFCLTRLGLRNERTVPLPLHALHVFSTAGSARGRLRMGDPATSRVYRHGWQSWSPAMSLSATSRDLRSAPPVLAPEPPAQDAGRFDSDDVGVLYDPGAGASLLAGAVTARDMLTQVSVDATARALDARCLADGAPLDPGATAWSEWLLIDLDGRPQDQLERYGDALAALMGARVPASTPAGWCSWYYFFTQVTEDDVVRNLRFLESHRRELPIDTVQVDDGYQADIGDWLTPNQKFPHGMAWLAAEIKRAGYRPGLWLAPFLLAETSRTFRAHPEWAVRDADGTPALATRNWERDCYGVDGSHPEAQAWLRDLFREICDGWGYDYVKIDFLFGAAIAGRRHDPSATRVRAYRAALAAVRDGVGDDRFMLGCGSLMAPSVGFFDGNRIGPDVAPWWRFISKTDRDAGAVPSRGPDDQLSAETAIRNTLTRWWMHGRLWANDPDCVLVRADRTRLTLDEVQSLVSAVGITAGMALSSDDLPQVPSDRIALLSTVLPPLPRPASPLDVMERDMPETLELVDDRPFDPLRVVALFNFADEPRACGRALPPGRWHAFELWSARYLGVSEREVRFDSVPPHGCRLLSLRPVLDRPQVVASDAHVGMGISDITSQQWDGGVRRLTVGLAPVGRSHRRIWLAGGPVEQAEFGGVKALPRDLGAGVSVVELDVSAAGNLAVSFRS